MQVVMQYYISRCNKAKKKGTKNKSPPLNLRIWWLSRMKSRDCLAGRKSSAPPKSRASMGCQGRSSLGLGDKVESSQTVSINKGRSVVLYPYAVKNIKWHFSSFFFQHSALWSFILKEEEGRKGSSSSSIRKHIVKAVLKEPISL